MDDLISRQAAIDVIDAVFPVDPMKSEYAQGIACGAALAKTYVEQLPSAQKKGHWIGEHLKYPSGYITFIYHCSECGYEERHAYEDSKPSNFCPNCGADMRGDTDE